MKKRLKAGCKKRKRKKPGINQLNERKQRVCEKENEREINTARVGKMSTINQE